ncbi:hypothetical protein JOQ06_003435 [Pogonophryne albipinna]|nr:hypothetical protein NQZ68_011496 [Dissostichus eleginoides]KAJ4924479.1 hypothetical protein JOQ06_003435 [Pogonophryne albipinna]KAK1906125.1 Lon protease like mitochondrial [Dissostichus eleginoides]
MPAGGGKMKGTGSGDGGRRSRGLGRPSSNHFLDCSLSAGGRRGFPSVGGDVMRPGVKTSRDELKLSRRRNLT